jgi:class 3 adenylate cyclase
MLNVDPLIVKLHSMLCEVGQSRVEGETAAKEFELRARLAVEPKQKEHVGEGGSMEADWRARGLFVSTAFVGQRLACELKHIRDLVSVVRNEFFYVTGNLGIRLSDTCEKEISNTISEWMHSCFVDFREKLRQKFVEYRFDFLNLTPNFGIDWLADAIKAEAVQAVRLCMIENGRAEADASPEPPSGSEERRTKTLADALLEVIVSVQTVRSFTGSAPRSERDQAAERANHAIDNAKALLTSEVDNIVRSPLGTRPKQWVTETNRALRSLHGIGYVSGGWRFLPHPSTNAALAALKEIEERYQQIASLPSAESSRPSHPQMNTYGKHEVANLANAASLLEYVGEKSATLAIVFTDIQKSIPLTRKSKEKAFLLIREKHFSRARRLLKRYNGKEVKAKGDGLIIVFKGNTNALNFAIGLHRKTGHESVQIRIGIHVGSVGVESNGDITGYAVSFTERVESAARPTGLCISNGFMTAIRQKGEHEHLRWNRKKGHLKGIGQRVYWKLNRSAG